MNPFVTTLNQLSGLRRFACPHCLMLPMTGLAYQTLDHLQDLTVILKAPVIISSGYRCPAYNEQLAGAAPASMHPLAAAVDIFIGDLDLVALPGQAKSAGFRYVEIHPERGYAHLQSLAWP